MFPRSLSSFLSSSLSCSGQENLFFTGQTSQVIYYLPPALPGINRVSDAKMLESTLDLILISPITLSLLMLFVINDFTCWRNRCSASEVTCRAQRKNSHESWRGPHLVSMFSKVGVDASHVIQPPQTFPCPRRCLPVDQHFLVITVSDIC